MNFTLDTKGKGVKGDSDGFEVYLLWFPYLLRFDIFFGLRNSLVYPVTVRMYDR